MVAMNPLVPEGVRPLKRVEYERLASEGYFDEERVELLFGMVVEMSPPDPRHSRSTHLLRELLSKQLAGRAEVWSQDAFAASDISEPEPDVFVVPNGDYWREHPSRAFLVVEVSRTSLRKERGTKALLYGLAEVDEYWIVDHEHELVEVYRDGSEGRWATLTTHRRGDTIAMRAFPDVAIAVSDILPPP